CISYMHSDLIISQADSRPMYLQLIDQIRRRIAVGDWHAGYELPSIRTLAADVSVSVITVKRAYLELERAGLIVTRQGKGSFVADGADLGRRLQEQELTEHLAAAANLAEMLGLSDDETERRLREARSRATDGRAAPHLAATDPAATGIAASNSATAVITNPEKDNE
ncbi:MAG: GntR family transcriptional regulator, partial [Steroidobacteraceae bacterium]